MPGAAMRWWLQRTLAALDTDLQAIDSRLLLRRGPSAAALHTLVRETHAVAVAYSERYEPAALTQAQVVTAKLKSAGVQVQVFPGNVLWPPSLPRTNTGRHYEVFTPYWRACQRLPEPPLPLPKPPRLLAPKVWPASESYADLGLLPQPVWTQALAAHWTPGTVAAEATLMRFITESLVHYAHGRHRPDLRHTSRLSPYLAVGAISARMVWHAVAEAAALDARAAAGAAAFQRELGWREFATHLLVHRPETPNRELKAEWQAFPWREDAHALRAWQRGRSGYDLVDAGMCELWQTGWMHNRVRMVVASFLVKDLLLDWRLGAAWFWDTLIDADLANNTLGWQWSAGCGADAAPFFRIFNPTTQAERFDPDGAYRARWLGDRVPPPPLVDHAVAREAALEAYEFVKAAR